MPALAASVQSGLAERDSGRGGDPGYPPARERAPDRERGVLAGRADHDRRDREEGHQGLEHRGKYRAARVVATSRFVCSVR